MTAITVGLINNMPDSALVATEGQFRALLEGACGATLEMRCTSIPEVPRGETAAAHIQQRYWALEDFLASPPDALIITGAEPVAADLRDEPYWQRLAALADWVQSLHRPSIWSCLAAHAAVLHLSGIPRQRLAEKCCGIYDHDVDGSHPLLANLTSPLMTPQSRWNDLPLNALREAGYSILSSRAETGANVFVGNHGRAQMVFLQGHPEYDGDTLLREYRRDIGRYVRFKQPHYPTLPHGYFSDAAIETLTDFRHRAEKNRTPYVMSEFPVEMIQAGLENTWRASAIQLYRNWLKPITVAGAAVPTESAGMLE